MNRNVCVFLADGFEEIEGLTVVDLLRRAGAQVTTVSIMGRKTIHGSHGIDVTADRLFEETDFAETGMLVLPGGMPGTTNLGEHKGLEELILRFHKEEKYVAAICAAPSIFGKLGMLKGRKAVSYPAMEELLDGAEVLKVPVVKDGHIITSRGMGTAIDFALALTGILFGEEKAKALGESIIYHV